MTLVAGGLLLLNVELVAEFEAYGTVFAGSEK